MKDGVKLVDVENMVGWIECEGVEKMIMGMVD